jgi:hypothetical protein
MHHLGIRSGYKGRQRLDGANGKVEQQLGVPGTHALSFESAMALRLQVIT